MIKIPEPKPFVFGTLGAGRAYTVKMSLLKKYAAIQEKRRGNLDAKRQSPPF